MIKKLISMPIRAVKGLFFPEKSFLKVLTRSNLEIIIRVIATQIMMSLVFISFMYNSPDMLNGDSVEIVTYSFYASIVLIPLIFALITMPIHWASTSLLGKGKFIEHYKLVMYSFFNGFIYMMFVGVASSILMAFFAGELMRNIAYSLFMSQGVFIVYQLLVSIKVAHNFSWPRTLSSGGLIAFAGFMIWSSSLLMKSF